MDRDRDLSKRYKIVYIVTNCKKTGPMNQTLNIIKNLDKKRFEPILVTLFPEVDGNSMIKDYKAICSEVHSMGMNKYISILIGKRKLTKLFSEIKPNLIQGVGMPPYTMSLGYKNAKHLVTLRNYCYEDYPAKYGRGIGRIIAYKDMRLIKKQISSGEVFVTCSSSLSEMYKDKHGMIFDFIRNGVDISKYSRNDNLNKIDMRKKLNLPINGDIVIYTGQIIERKDQKSAIEGILNSKYSSDVILLLLGEGKNYQELKEKYKMSSNIVFKGRVSNVSEYLKASDFYISTSKSEGMPNGVLEAMAVGLPVLLSDIPQHNEIFDINKKIGVMYKIGKLSSLIQGIDKMFNSNLECMSNESYKTVSENLTAEIMSEKYQKLYTSLLDN